MPSSVLTCHKRPTAENSKGEIFPSNGPVMLNILGVGGVCGKGKKKIASGADRKTHMNFSKDYSANAILNRHTSMNSSLTFMTILNNATKDFSRFM